MKICISIAEKTQAKVINALKEVSEKADFAEIIPDRIKDLDLKALINASPLKLVISSRLSGHLMNACTLGAQYVDIPLRMPEKLSTKIVQHARREKSGVIISHHDFSGTPKLKQLQKIADKMKSLGGDVIKIAVTAKQLDDVIVLCALAVHLRQKKIKHILIAMGKKGQLSRILTPTLGGEMMFACLSKKRQTAPGQLTADELKKAWSMLKVKN